MTNQAITFFKSKPIYKKICQKAYDKYRSFGIITGTLKLTSFSDDEIDDIASFLGMPVYKLNQKNSFKLEDWLNSYSKSKFKDVPFEDVVAAVVGKPLQYHKDLREDEGIKRTRFIETIREQYCGFDFMDDKQVFQYLYLQRDNLDTIIAPISRALLNLPSKPMYLPNFAQMIALNPHAFDLKTEVGSLLYQVLKLKSTRLQELNTSEAEYRTAIYLENNIILDNIQNYISVHGFKAIDKKTQEPHPMWKAAVEYNVTWNVPIKHILDIETIKPHNTNTVFIFENSSLFSAIVDKMPHISAVCTHGQFRNASWEFFKRIPEHVSLYYSGDFDPEGLQMTQAFLNRFHNAVPFCMDLNAYEHAITQTQLSDHSLSRLKSVTDLRLTEVRDAMQTNKRAGYQEELFELYLEQITKHLTVE